MARFDNASNLAVNSGGYSDFNDKPREVVVESFVRDRAKEISNLLAVIDNSELPKGEVCQGPRTYVQRMPRHLRRRAMSHNVKRLPHRTREFAASFVQKSNKRKKPPSRYHKRRPANLLKAYIRRQRKHKWLETHIWHAKRFHVRNVWGYRLAYRSCARGHRAFYRDTARHCTVQDCSFLCCIEIYGSREIIAQRLSDMCCSQSVGLTFRSKMALNGRYELTTVLYRPNQYPYGCVGPVSFEWKPTSSEGQGTLWVWTHPSITEEILDIFKFVLNLDARKETEIDPDMCANAADVKSLRDFQQIRSATNRVFWGADATMTVLSDTLVRFKLTGPLSTVVLKTVCKFPATAILDAVGSEGPLASFMQNRQLVPDVAAMKTDWQALGNAAPSTQRHGTIVYGLFADPRLTIPSKRAKPKPVESCNGQSTSNFSSVCSLLWDRNFCRNLLERKISDGAINDGQRNKDCSPFSVSAEDLLNCGTAIPALLIARNPSPNTQCTGFGSGWDLVLPAGWAMPFWVALQYATARAAGLQEARKTNVEAGGVTFPDDWIDTLAGRTACADETKEMKEKYQRKPYNRRIKYEKMKIAHPFDFPWCDLLHDWQSAKLESSNDISGEEKFYVLKERKALSLLKQWFSGQLPDAMSKQVSQIFSSHQRALVCVRLEAVGKGRPMRHALICCPSSEDNWQVMHTGHEPVCAEKVDAKQGKGVPENGPKKVGLDEDFLSFSDALGETELCLNAIFVDKAQAKLQARKDKSRQQKKERKRRKLTRKNDSNTLEAQADHSKQTKSTNVVDSCARSVMGFVVDGDYSFQLGHGAGVGYCSLAALKSLRKVYEAEPKKLGLVLYRNTMTRFYRAARLTLNNW